MTQVEGGLLSAQPRTVVPRSSCAAATTSPCCPRVSPASRLRTNQEFTHLSPAPADPGEGRAATIRRLNDAMLRTFTGGRVMLTAGVAALPDAMRIEALAAVQAFDPFDADDDPGGEHEFGAVEIGNLELYCKIEYYDRNLKFTFPDPVNTGVKNQTLLLTMSE